MLNWLQVFTPQAAILFILAGGGLFLYFKYEKERLKEQKRAFTSFVSLLL